MPAAGFLSEEEVKRLGDAVGAAAERSAGSVCPVVAARSSHYERAADLVGVFAAVAVSVLLWRGAHDGIVGLHWLLPAQFVAFLFGALVLARSDWLRFAVAGRALMTQRVRDAAQRTMTLGRTDKPCVLIYVSVFERQVAVLADESASAKIDSEALRPVRDAAAKGMRDGKPGEGLCTAVNLAAELLAKHFPPEAGVRGEG